MLFRIADYEIEVLQKQILSAALHFTKMLLLQNRRLR